MYCTKCGMSLAEGTKFCTKCGNKVESVAVPVKESIPEEPVKVSQNNPFVSENDPVIIAGGNESVVTEKHDNNNGFYGASNTPQSTPFGEYADRKANGIGNTPGNGYNSQPVNTSPVDFQNENVQTPVTNVAQKNANNNPFTISQEDDSEDFGNKTVRVRGNRNGKLQSDGNGYNGGYGNNAGMYDERQPEKKEFFSSEVPESGSKKKKKKTGGKTVLKALVAVVLVIAVTVGGVVAFIFAKKNAPEAYSNLNNTSERYVNVVRDGKNIFYVNENGFIVRTDENGENRSVIVDDTTTSYLYLKSNKLYYLSSTDDYVYSCSYDGGDKEKVILNKVYWFAVAGKYIYYRDGYTEMNEKTGADDIIGNLNLYRCDTDGKNVVCLVNSEVSKICVGEENIVYRSRQNGALYVIGIDGGESKLILEKEKDSEISNFKIYDDKIYALVHDNEVPAKSGIFSMAFDGSNKEKIVNTEGADFTIVEGKIVYADPVDKDTNICDLDGKNKDVLIEGTVINRPKIYGDYLYYNEFFSAAIDIYEYDFKNKTVRCLENEMTGNVVFADGYMFYIDNSDSNIYRCDSDGNNKIQLTDGECLSIYAHNDELYFYGYANGYSSDEPETAKGINTLGVYKLDTDGTSCSAVELNCKKDVVFYGDSVYFADEKNSGIYKTSLSNVDTDADNTAYITSEDHSFGAPLLVDGDFIYLNATKDGKTFFSRVSMSTKAVEYLYTGKVRNVQLNDKKIYYVANNENGESVLCQMNLDGSAPAVVMLGEINDYAVYERIVYYVDPVTGHINSISVGSQKPEELNESASSNVVINGNTIYFNNRYDNGYVYSMKLDGSDEKVVIGESGKNEEIKDRTDYRTNGIDGAVSVK